MTLEERLRAAAAIGWDAAIAAMKHEDGTPVEIVTVVNPYREEHYNWCDGNCGGSCPAGSASCPWCEEADLLPPDPPPDV